MEVGLTKEHNKRFSKADRKNADGSYKTQIRIGEGGKTHYYRQNQQDPH